MLADCISTHTRTWRCLLVLLVAVAGIVTGILAMHVVGTPASEPHELTMSHVAAATPMHSHEAATLSAAMAPTNSDTSATGGCAADGCDPMHDMTAMVCTLALLAVAVLLIGPTLSRAVFGAGMRAAPATLIRSRARTIGSSPPSLLALSVDRR